MQKDIKSFFLVRSTSADKLSRSSSVSNASAPINTDSSPESVPDNVKNSKEGDITSLSSLGTTSCESTQANDSVQTQSQPSQEGSQGSKVESADIPAEKRVVEDSFEDDEPIVRKRCLMFDGGFVPSIPKDDNENDATTVAPEPVASIQPDICESSALVNRMGSIAKLSHTKKSRAKDILSDTSSDSCVFSFSSVYTDSSLGTSCSALSRLDSTSSIKDGDLEDVGSGGVLHRSSGDDLVDRADTHYQGHDGDVEELSFDEERHKAESEAPSAVDDGSQVKIVDLSQVKLTVGKEPLHPYSQSEDCATDQDRKMYLNCAASQKSRGFKAYVECYYRYNQTFVFPPWVCVETIKDRDGRKPTDDNYDPSTIWIPPKGHRWATEYRSGHYTDCMQQWWNIKQDRFDQLLFFKMGRFYELFYHDACIVQQICGLRWMGSEAKPHVGFPEKSLHIYASSCVEHGYKVVVVEQTETPQQLEQRNRESGQRQNAVSRAICEIITPGTITRPEMLTKQSRPLLLITDVHREDMDAVTDAKCGNDEGFTSLSHNESKEKLPTSLGRRTFELPRCLESGTGHMFCVCSFDASVGSLCLGTVDISLGMGQLRAIIAALSPAEVVVDSTLSDHLEDLREMATYLGFELTSFDCFEDVTHATVGDKDAPVAEVDYTDFMNKVNATLGHQTFMYQRVILLVQRYLKSVMLNNLLNYCTISILSSNYRDCMTLDCAVLTQLELFKSQEGDVSSSLFGVLNKTSCAFGERMLRQWLLKPLTCANRINERSAVVEFFHQNFSVCRAYQDQLCQLPDLERSFGKLLNAAAGCYKMAVYFDEGIFLKQYTMHQMMEQFMLLQRYVKALFSDCGKTGQDLPILLQDMNKAIQDVAPHCEYFLSLLDISGPKSCHTRPGVWQESDRIRDSINQTVSALQKELEEIRDMCPSAKFVHTKFRYEVEIQEKEYRRIATAKAFEVTSTRSGFVRIHNRVIVSLVADLSDHEFALSQSELQFFQHMVKQLHDRRDVFNKLLVIAAELDCLCSLAAVAKNSVLPLTRAEVIDRGTREPFVLIRDAVHPIVSQIDPEGFVPNDVQLGHGDYQPLILLTGPNMGGKSTLLRQVALCVIMAQMGSFVPGSECKMTVVDRVFTRLGAYDNIIQGKSTFLIEMEEASTILHSATRDSLVLVDELGRGTSTFEATAIAAACLEKLSAIGCRGVFTTHFHEVWSYAKKLANVSLCHMAASLDDKEKSITFLYKLSLGLCPESHGIHVARLAGIPKHVTDMAEVVSRSYRASKRPIKSILQALLEAHKQDNEPLFRRLYDELRNSLHI